MQQSAGEQSEYDFYRKLTPIDVDQALYALKINENTNALSKQECDCCRLRRTHPSSHLLLPLARRGRPHIPTRSHRLLCSNCTEIKRQQQIAILQTQQQFHSDQIYETVIDFDLSSEHRIALNNHQYQSAQMLVWKMNSSDENTINLSCDTDSLTENQKQILLDETIKKLRMILNNRPTIRDQDNFEFTYRTLQTTINILSSSRNSI